MFLLVLIRTFIDAQSTINDKNGVYESSVETMFTNYFMEQLIEGLSVKDKSVRLRSCKLLALSLDYIEEMEYVS